jgi:adenylosuccinate lyase
MSFFLDQISEHQRDLTNSASQRFTGEFIAGFLAALARMEKVVASLHVDRERLFSNLKSAGDMVLAEAAYILLAEGGEPDAHEKIRLFTLECEKNSTSLKEELAQNPVVWKMIVDGLALTSKAGPEEFFSQPELYRGRSVEKTLKIVELSTERLKFLKEALS